MIARPAGAREGPPKTRFPSLHRRGGAPGRGAMWASMTAGLQQVVESVVEAVAEEEGPAETPAAGEDAKPLRAPASPGASKARARAVARSAPGWLRRRTLRVALTRVALAGGAGWRGA